MLLNSQGTKPYRCSNFNGSGWRKCNTRWQNVDRTAAVPKVRHEINEWYVREEYTMMAGTNYQRVGVSVIKEKGEVKLIHIAFVWRGKHWPPRDHFITRTLRMEQSRLIAVGEPLSACQLPPLSTSSALLVYRVGALYGETNRTLPPCCKSSDVSHSFSAAWCTPRNDALASKTAEHCSSEIMTIRQSLRTSFHGRPS